MSEMHAREMSTEEASMDWQDGPLQKAAALEGIASNQAFPLGDRLGAAIQAAELLRGYIGQMEASTTESPRELIGDRDESSYIWRLTMECGHLAIWGPFDNDSYRRYVGQVGVCEICPRTHHELAMRIIVDVNKINPDQYRKPDSKQLRVRNDYMLETHS